MIKEKQNLLDILNNRIQTFITTTSIDGIEHHVIKEAKKININRKEETMMAEENKVQHSYDESRYPGIRRT